MILQLRPEVIEALNLQYKTRKFVCKMTAKQIIDCAQQAMKSNIDTIDYQLNGNSIQRYGIKVQVCQIDPFPAYQQMALNKLVNLIDQLSKAAKETSFVVTSVLQKIMDFINNDKMSLTINQRYHKYLLYFKHINIKEVLVFQALSRCQIFYTMVKERKKSGKEFSMDTLINFFQNIKNRLGLPNAFHQSVLPRKQLKFFQKKSTDKKMKNTLFDAVSNRKYKEVKQLVVKGGVSIQQPGIVQKNKREMNCSHRACQLGDLQMCRILHSFNVDWSVKQKEGLTPLHFAVQAGNLDVVKFLIEQVKVEIEAKDIQQRTPFYFAVTEGDLHIVRYLYEKGADINNKSKLGRSALSKSCYLGLVDVVSFLISCPGIILASQDGKGRTALHNAVFGPKGGREGHKFGTNQKDSPECTQLLLENGFDVDYLDLEQNTPLHVSMSSDGIDSIKVLLAFGASLTKRNCYGQTPLMTGAKFGHLDSVKLLRAEGASLVIKDIFGKNLMLLCAKFRQDDGKAVNEVFYYSTNQILSMAKRKDQLDHKSKDFIVNWEEQIDYTFYELLKQVVRVRTQFKYFGKKCKQNELGVTNLTLEHIKMLIDFIKNSEDKEQFDLVQYFISNRPNHHKIILKKQQFEAFISWIIAQNSTKLFDFFVRIEGSLKKYLQVQNQQYISLLQYLGTSTLDMIPIMKEKVLTYCLLKLNINWLDYIDTKNYYNIIHLLVRYKKIGTLIQILKVLTGIRMDFITNQHVLTLLQEQLTFRLAKTSGDSPLELILRNMLLHRDRQGFDPYHLALLMKDASSIRLLQQKLNKHTIINKQQFQVKDYTFIVQQNAVEVQNFNKGYQIQNQLEAFLQLLESFNTLPQLSQYFSAFKTKQQIISQALDIDDFKSVWRDINNRKLWHIEKIDDLQNLSRLGTHKLIGIDIQYFYAQGATLISIMQISSLTEDYIIDFLYSAKSHQTYYDFVEAVKRWLVPIAYDRSIMKIMHGSDNDLCVIKSVLKFSFLNFVDTARIDVELRKEQNIRGLATLVKDYLGEHMSKDYQVSEWRIRPIPSSMLDYARRDSLVLPFLVRKMMHQLELGRLKQMLAAGCRQAKRNRKSSQPLIRSIQAL